MLESRWTKTSTSLETKIDQYSCFFTWNVELVVLGFRRGIGKEMNTIGGNSMVPQSIDNRGVHPLLIAFVLPAEQRTAGSTIRKILPFNRGPSWSRKKGRRSPQNEAQVLSPSGVEMSAIEEEGERERLLLCFFRVWIHYACTYHDSSIINGMIHILRV